MPELAPWMRLAVFVAGWILVLVGIAGLFLPVLQGWLTIFLGAAVLSLVSEGMFGMLRKVLRRWPKGWQKVLHFRRRANRRLLGWSERIEVWVAREPIAADRIPPAPSLTAPGAPLGSRAGALSPPLVPARREDRPPGS